MDSNPPLDGIIARDVTVTYRNGHTALREASFAIPRGTITALVGVNGAGKSTLFKAIMGFVPAARGEISLMGKTVREALKSNMVAYVPQAEEVDWAFPVLVEDVVMMGRFGHMSAAWREGRAPNDAVDTDADATRLQQLMGSPRIIRQFATQMFWDVWRLFKNPKQGVRRMRGVLRIPSKADYLAVDEALDRVNMKDFRRRQIGELSGGQRKRVFLARALAQDGKVILLDEPFTGVDVKTEDQIIALLRELRDEGRVMLVSTHNLGSVPEFCDRTVLVKGTVLAHGLTEEVFTHDNLEKAFGGVLRHFTLSGEELHDDDDPREVMITTDDERPFVRYGVKRGADE